MNAITMNFADATGGLIKDAGSFFAADDATRARAFSAWRMQDAQTALSFRDTIDRAVQDAQVGYAFLTPQLHRIETEVYMTRRPNYDLTNIMAVNQDGDMWDVGTVVYSMDEVGKATFLSGKGFDMPYADAMMKQDTRAFNLAGIGYEWTMQEMQRAARLGRALSSDKADAASLAAAVFKRSVAMTGKAPGAANSEKNWTGLINNPSVPTANVAADGTGSATTWATKTPDQIARDFWAAVNAIPVQTNETHIATKVGLPPEKARYIAQTRMTDTGSTILAYINAAPASQGRTVEVVEIRELKGAGAGSTDRMIAYDDNRQVAQFHLPGDHEFLPAFQKGSMTYEVGGIMNVGGTEVRLPKAMTYRDGI